MKLLLLVLGLGLDTLLVSASLSPDHPLRLRLAVVLALFEGGMPVIGAVLGHAAGQLIGGLAQWAGSGLLLLVGGYLLFWDPDEKIPSSFSGGTLILLGLSVSLDELAVGFSVALTGVALSFVIAGIVIQAFFFSFLGSWLGPRVQALGSWGHRLPGILVGALGCWGLVGLAFPHGLLGG